MREFLIVFESVETNESIVFSAPPIKRKGNMIVKYPKLDRSLIRQVQIDTKEKLLLETGRNFNILILNIIELSDNSGKEVESESSIANG